MISWFIMPPRELQSLGTNIAGGAVFAQNFILLGQVGYFGLTADFRFFRAFCERRYHRD